MQKLINIFFIGLLCIPAYASYNIPDGGVTGKKLNANTVDNSTLQLTSNQLSIKAVGTSQITNGAVTPVKRAALGQQVTSTCGTFITSSSSFVTVTNQSIAITTTGRPVMVFMMPDGTTNNSDILAPSSGTFIWQIRRDGVSLGIGFADGAGTSIYFPVGGMQVIDTGASAGSHTYDLQIRSAGSATMRVENSVMAVFEL